MIKATVVRLWLVLMLMATSMPDAARSFASAENTSPPAPAASSPSVLPVGNTDGVEVGASGGVVDLPDGGDLTVPQGALPANSRFSRYTVEMRQAGGLLRYHPLAEAVHIEARRSDNGTSITGLQKPATVRLKLGRPISDKSQPAVRVQGAAGWELVSSSYDQSSKTVTVSLSQLPATLAIVDDSEPSWLWGVGPRRPGGGPAG